MAKESKMHQELFDWLREKNLPENEIPRDEKEWFREIAVGFNRLGMEKPDLSESYRRAAEEIIKDENIKRILRKQQQLKLLDSDLYKKIAQKEWSRDYGFFRPSLIQSIDYVCIIGKRAWVLEGKDYPTHEAIGQVLGYKDLFKEDYPLFEEVKMGIVCKNPNPLNEPTCSKLGISIFRGGGNV
jgi:hypothetical protein